jgi:primosomal protein N' (replication factor Y)
MTPEIDAAHRAPPLVVALDLPLRAGDAAFTFAGGPAAGAPRGTGVVVPFGRRLMPGIVLGPGQPREGLRPVLAVVQPGPLIPASTVDLAEWAAREYLSSVGEALAVAVPWDALWHSLRLSWVGAAPSGLPDQVRAVAEALSRRPASLARAGRMLAGLPQALAWLADASAIAATVPMDAPAGVPCGTAAGSQKRIGAPPGPPPGGDAPQAGRRRPPGVARADAAVQEAMESGPRTVLVAGCGRTPAYMAAARRALAAGWSCIAAFASLDEAEAFAQGAESAGLGPVLVHGGLPKASRLRAWRSLAGARGALAVGTRSAVFAPLADPALVIVDSEDSSGHKEERAPRYATAGVAAERTRERGVLVLGADTPTVASYAGVASGAARLVALPSPPARVGVVDLRGRPGPSDPVSRPLLDAVARTVRSRGRAVLLADRKGYASGLHCAECGAVEQCPRCAVALPYDRHSRGLRCRFCGHRARAPDVCSRCGGARLRLLGAGTERIAAAVRRVTALVWRLDSDVLAREPDVAAHLEPLRRGGGVLVSTAVILPWLEVIRPDLVAVVAADRMLHRPEFRASERALALLRTAGMAARTRVIVETADPGHPAIRALQGLGLRQFYASELAMRQALGYPPFRALASVTFTARSAASAEAAAARLMAAAAPPLEAMGPSPLSVQLQRDGRLFARQVVIRAANRGAICEMLLPVLTGGGLPQGVLVSADVDPHDL